MNSNELQDDVPGAVSIKNDSPVINFDEYELGEPQSRKRQSASNEDVPGHFDVDYIEKNKRICHTPRNSNSEPSRNNYSESEYNTTEEKNKQICQNSTWNRQSERTRNGSESEYNTTEEKNKQICQNSTWNRQSERTRNGSESEYNTTEEKNKQICRNSTWNRQSERTRNGFLEDGEIEQFDHRDSKKRNYHQRSSEEVTRSRYNNNLGTEWDHFWPPNDMFKIAESQLKKYNRQPSKLQKLLSLTKEMDRKFKCVNSAQDLITVFGEDKARELLIFYCITNGTLRKRIKQMEARNPTSVMEYFDIL